MELMKYSPILFSTPMVQAILNGSKTQTRRVVKGLDNLKEPFFQSLVQHAYGKITFASLHSDEVVEPKCPYGQIGDVLWVRETFHNCSFENDKCFLYKSDFDKNAADLVKWKPGIHMPKDACRLFLKIKDVRVERLQDISEEDAKKEGVETKPYGSYPFFCTIDYLSSQHSNGFRPGFCADTGKQFISSFTSLWRKIYGRDYWEANPWVWVIEFERIEKPINFC